MSPSRNDTFQEMVRYLISVVCVHALIGKDVQRGKQEFWELGNTLTWQIVEPVSLGSISLVSLCKLSLYNHSYVIKDAENVEGIPKQSIK